MFTIKSHLTTLDIITLIIAGVCLAVAVVPPYDRISVLNLVLGLLNFYLGLFQKDPTL